jgi:hypothetical protein
LPNKSLMEKVLISPKWSNENCWLWLGTIFDNIPTYKDNYFRVFPRLIMWQAYNPHETYPTKAEIVTPSCGVTECVNPYHLEKISRKEAIVRGLNRTPIVAKERYAKITHCPHGHEYTAENTGYNFSTWGNQPQGKIYKGRFCLICRRERNRKRKAKNGATRLARDYDKGGLLSLEVMDMEFKRPPRGF